jgi:hypothetical protein
MNESLKRAVVSFLKDPRKSSGLEEASVARDVAVQTNGNIATFESDPPVRPVHRTTGGSVSGECQRFVI